MTKTEEAGLFDAMRKRKQLKIKLQNFKHQVAVKFLKRAATALGSIPNIEKEFKLGFQKNRAKIKVMGLDWKIVAADTEWWEEFFDKDAPSGVHVGNKKITVRFVDRLDDEADGQGKAHKDVQDLKDGIRHHKSKKKETSSTKNPKGTPLQQAAKRLANAAGSMTKGDVLSKQTIRALERRGLFQSLLKKTKLFSRQ